MVDHIKPHKGNEDLFYDINNLQFLCKSCHDRKAAKEEELKLIDIDELIPYANNTGLILQMLLSILLINPPYSLMLNPQENVWNKLKSYFYEYRARSTIDEIKNFILDYFGNANSNKAKTKSLVNARSYYK